MKNPRVPGEVANRPVTSEQPIADEIEFEIARLSGTLALRAIVRAVTFGPELEASFTTDTALARSRELRLSIAVGLGCYFITAVLDGALVPDLNLGGVMLRLALVPVPVWFIVTVPRMRPGARELCATAVAMIAVGSLITIAAASSSPYASYALNTVTLAAIFANAAIPLRFRHACLSTAAALFGVLLTAHFDRHITGGLTFALDLQASIGCLFSLQTAFRLERSARLTYLLYLKEQRRLDDVAAEREAYSALSQTDGLTGLGNRMRLDQWCEAAVGSQATADLEVGVLMIDIDDFKGYNDFYGHGAGDRCLQAIAATIGAVPRHGKDLAVRYGGEEFVVILAEVTATEVVVAARRLLAAVAELRLDHATRTDGMAVVTISIGVAHTGPGAGSRLRDVLEAADNALYAAKRNGRNRVEVAFEPLLLAAS